MIKYNRVSENEFRRKVIAELSNIAWGEDTAPKYTDTPVAKPSLAWEAKGGERA